MSEQRLIDANALLKTVELTCGDYFEHGDRAYDKIAVKVAIQLAPTIERPAVQGRWIKPSFWDFCSECNAKFDSALGVGDYNFCPNCGAEMIGGFKMRTAERENRCVVLPCSIGTKVWTIENVFNGNEVVQMLGSRTIDEIKHNKLNKNTMISKQPFELHFYPSEIGKTLFFTKEEAENALKGSD